MEQEYIQALGSHISGTVHTQELPNFGSSHCGGRAKPKVRFRTKAMADVTMSSVHEALWALSQIFAGAEISTST